MRENKIKASILNQQRKKKMKCWERRTRLPIAASDQLADPKANVTKMCLS